MSPYSKCFLELLQPPAGSNDTDSSPSRRKQIESLMAKLNESKKSDRAAKNSLDEATRRYEEWRQKAEDAEKAAKSAQALQNTIDHLENRLEIANIERLDAQEQLFHVQTKQSPFDVEMPQLQLAIAKDGDPKVRRSSPHPNLLRPGIDTFLDSTECPSEYEHGIFI
jgi:chromosome segregation ATPase